MRVCTLYPGRTATSMQRSVRAPEAGEYREADYLAPGTVAQVVEMMLTLPSDGVLTDVTLRPCRGCRAPLPPRHTPLERRLCESDQAILFIFSHALWGPAHNPYEASLEIN